MWFRGILNGVILFLLNSRRGWKPAGRITRLLASETRAGLRPEPGADLTVRLEEKVVLLDLTKLLQPHLRHIYYLRQ